MRVAVIGAGPSGLATLKHLITAHQFFSNVQIEARLFESESAVGGTFRFRAYEGAEMVSSRQLTTFSDYRIPSPAPDFLSPEKYCCYLEDYCKKFDLWPHIDLSTRVTHVERVEGCKHRVHYTQDGQDLQWDCDAIAICSGLHVLPNIPVIEGLEYVPTVIHSSQFKEKKQFGRGKDILILGSGETAMDLAYLAIKSDTNSVTLSHRDGFHVAHKRSPNPIVFGNKPRESLPGTVPYDVGATSLFDTAYVHPVLREWLSFLPWLYHDRFTKWTSWLVSGTTAGVDQWVGELPPERYHASKIFFNKSTLAMPYISAPYRRPSLLDKIRSQIFQIHIPSIKGRYIDLAPWPRKISENGVVRFVENGRPEAAVMRIKTCRPDIVILATGYSQVVPFLDETYPIPAKADVRNIWKSGDESVAFIGFVRPSFGAIPPLAELQAQLWILSLLKLVPNLNATLDSHYRLNHAPSSRIQYGVDHDAYAYQLATDAGSAPSFTNLLSEYGMKTTLSWALSSNVNTKFRLTGPWKWDGAKEIMEGEIWETITRRDWLFGHILLSFLPMTLFGVLSVFLCILEFLGFV